MPLPLQPPLLPQLARGKTTLPAESGWAYEPKYDGFRAIAFVDGDAVELQSRSGKDLTRYFPEVAFPPGRYVLDGELIIHAPDGGEEFDLLGQRIHPAASRIERLSVETPATYIAFDLLAREDEVLLERPYVERRAALEELVAAPVELTPTVATAEEADVWLQTTEGVIAKRLDAPYVSGSRNNMVKVKRLRTADAVIVGWRPGKLEGTLGAVILGMYEGDELRVVGHSSGFTAKQKRDLPGELAPYATGERGSGDPSRWSGGKDMEWVALRPELVVEVTYDHVSDGRIRHGTKIVRWRDDKAPRECTYDQLEE